MMSKPTSTVLLNRGNLHRRCVNCSLAVPRQHKKITLNDLSHLELNVLRSWIAPCSTKNGGILCMECYSLIRAGTFSEDIPIREFGHHEICCACGRSVLKLRTHEVSLECPERNFILRTIPEHQISRLQKVCLPCWMAANRLKLKQEQEDANRSVLQEVNISINEIKSEIPNISTNEIKSEIPTPPSLPPPIEAQNIPAEPKINSSSYKRAAASSRRCIFPGCQGRERLLVPNLIREMLLIHNKFYVPTSSRICRYHLDTKCWSELTSTYQDFTGAQFDHILNILRKAHSNRVDFENIANMHPHLCHYWLGMNVNQFEELLSCVPSLQKELNCPSLALCIYIVKLRTGESNKKLSSLFHMPRSTLERKMSIARKCLLEYFGCKDLGFESLIARLL